MAYKRNWDSDEKPPEKQMISYLMGILPDLVETAFLAVAESDDGGRHITMMAEWDENEQSPWKENSRNIDTKGWRVLRMIVPEWYLQAFYNADGTRRKTKERD